MVSYVGEICRSQRTSVISIRRLYSLTLQSNSLMQVASDLMNQHIPWLQAPPSIQEGSIWIFDMLIDQSTREEHVKSFRPFAEVIDLRMYKRSYFPDILKELPSITLSFVPSPQVYLWLDKDVWCGPVTLKRSGSAGKPRKCLWMLNLQSIGAFASLICLLEEGLVSLPLLPGRTFIPPWHQSSQPFAFVDLESFSLVDTIPLENVKDAQSMLDTFDVPDQKYPASLFVFPRQKDVSSSRKARSASDENVKVSTSLEKSVLLTGSRTETVQRQVKKPGQGKIDKKSEKNTRQEVSQITISSKKAKEVETKDLAEFSAQVTMKKQPLKPIKYIDVSCYIFDEIQKTLRSQGFLPSVATALHAAFLSGMIPLIVGQDAFDIFSAYASCVTGGRLLCIPIGASFQITTDLMRSVEPTSRIFSHNEPRLADLLLDARQNPDDLYLVVLDASYLTPLLSSYADRWNEENKHILPIFRLGTVSDKSAYRDPLSLGWPKNVLLAGSIADGPIRIISSSSFWDHVVLIDMNVSLFQASQSNTHQKSLPETHPLFKVSAKNWQQWCEEAAQISALTRERNWNLADIKLSGSGVQLCQRMSFTLLQFLTRMKSIDYYLLLLVWLPIAINTNQTDKVMRISELSQEESFLPDLLRTISVVQGK